MKKGIYLDHVNFSYPGRPRVLSDVTLTIEPGSFVGMTGTNGSGKSTCTLLMNGLIPHSIAGKLTGSVFIDGVNTRQKPVSYFARTVGMVFQNPDFSLFNLTVEEEVGFGLVNLTGSADKKRIDEALATVGLEGFQSRDPQALSYGEKQKVALASVLALDVSYIILDEPTSMLDYKSSVDLYHLLTELNKSGKTIITVEHDTDFLLTCSQEMIIFDHGKVLKSGKTKKVFSDHTLLQSLGIKIPRGASV